MSSEPLSDADLDEIEALHSGHCVYACCQGFGGDHDDTWCPISRLVAEIRRLRARLGEG